MCDRQNKDDLRPKKDEKIQIGGSVSGGTAKCRETGSPSQNFDSRGTNGSLREGPEENDWGHQPC